VEDSQAPVYSLDSTLKEQRAVDGGRQGKAWVIFHFREFSVSYTGVRGKQISQKS
jgi:hypothetical protein